MEYPKLEETHKDHEAQLLTPHSTTQNPNPVSESTVQMAFVLWQIRAVLTALGSLFHAHRPLVQTLSLTPNCPKTAELSVAPLLPVRSCSCHEVSPQLICAECTEGPQLLL